MHLVFFRFLFFGRLLVDVAVVVAVVAVVVAGEELEVAVVAPPAAWSLRFFARRRASPDSFFFFVFGLAFGLLGLSVSVLVAVVDTFVFVAGADIVLVGDKMKRIIHNLKVKSAKERVLEAAKNQVFCSVLFCVCQDNP